MATFGGSYKISVKVNQASSSSNTYTVPANCFFWGCVTSSSGAPGCTIDTLPVNQGTGATQFFVAGPGAVIVATSAGIAGISGVVFVNS